jgi:hypothetical protein
LYPFHPFSHLFARISRGFSRRFTEILKVPWAWRKLQALHDLRDLRKNLRKSAGNKNLRENLLQQIERIKTDF